jgi:hypothetical protein
MAARRTVEGFLTPDTPPEQRSDSHPEGTASYPSRLDLRRLIAENHFVVRFSRLVLVALVLPAARADEGLWPYNQFPAQALKEKHRFEAPAGFLDRLRLASVRVGGESGSFVSSKGLLLTARDVVGGCVKNDVFLATETAAELRCPGLDTGVLVDLADVTARVKVAGQSLAQRAGAVARVEKECAAKTGNVCSVVTLFSGGCYGLYQYKRSIDVRLVSPPSMGWRSSGKSATALHTCATAQYRFFARLRRRQAGRYAALSDVERERGPEWRSGFRVGQSGCDGAVDYGGAAHVLSGYRAAFGGFAGAGSDSATEWHFGHDRASRAVHAGASSKGIQAGCGEADRTARRSTGGAQDAI